MNPSLTAPLILATASPTTNEDLELSMAIATSIHSSSMDEQPLHPNAHKSILVSKPVDWINSSENSSTPNNRGPTRGPASPLGSSSSRWSYKPAQVGYNGWDVPEGGPSNSETQQSIPSTCVICLDAPIEGACIPCGHLSGCMSCLNEIQGKKWVPSLPRQDKAGCKDLCFLSVSERCSIAFMALCNCFLCPQNTFVIVHILLDEV